VILLVLFFASLALYLGCYWLNRRHWRRIVANVGETFMVRPDGDVERLRDAAKRVGLI
jgi:hypothetical protein